LLALILAGALAAWNLATWPVKLRYPGEENLAEGIPLVEMLHLRQGVRIYDPPTPERFDAANYGPLYYLVGARLLDPEKPSALPLRLVALLATLACAAGCATLALWLSGSTLAAALGALTFLSYRIVTLYGVSTRSDLVALCFCFWGFLVAYHFRRDRRLLWAIPLILLGVFYKPQFVAGPLAIASCLLLEKRYRLAIEFAGLLGMGGVAGLGLFGLVVFRGQALLRHLLVYNALPYSLERLGSGLLFFAALCFLPALVGLEYLRQHRDRLLTCFVGFALPLSVLTFGRQGSDANYFLESVAILCPLFAALLVERIGDAWRAAELLFLLGLSLVLGQFFALPPPTHEDFARDRVIQNYLRANFAPHTPALGYYTGDLVRAGLETPISNLFHYTWLVRQGLIPERDLETQIAAKRFGAVVFNFDLEHEQSQVSLNYYLTGPMRQAILANYQPAASFPMPKLEKFSPTDRFYVWIPKTTSP